MSTFINPYTDFGFKKLFGEEANKDLLADFLNQMLPPERQIADLTFQNPDQIPDLPKQRRSVFDVYCTAITGEHFIVEMQKTPQEYFKDRSIYYSTFPVRSQAKRGKWDYELAVIYLIAVLDFVYDDAGGSQKFYRDVTLKDQDGEVFYDKLHFKFLQMPLFDKSIEELETRFDKWCYFLKHLPDFDSIPAILKEPIFEKAFESARLANLTVDQYEIYELEMKIYRDNINTMEYMLKQAVEKAVEKAVEEATERATEKATEEATVNLVKNLIAAGMDDEFIHRTTGLSSERIAALRGSQ